MILRDVESRIAAQVGKRVWPSTGGSRMGSRSKFGIDRWEQVESRECYENGGRNQVDRAVKATAVRRRSMWHPVG